MCKYELVSDMGGGGSKQNITNCDMVGREGKKITIFEWAYFLNGP